MLQEAPILAHTVPTPTVEQLWKLSCSPQSVLWSPSELQVKTAAGESFWAQAKGCFASICPMSTITLYLWQSFHQAIPGAQGRGCSRGGRAGAAQLVPVPLHPGTGTASHLPLPPTLRGRPKGSGCWLWKQRQRKGEGRSVGGNKKNTRPFSLLIF